MAQVDREVNALVMKNIRRLRALHGMSTKTLAERVSELGHHISRSRVAKYENAPQYVLPFSFVSHCAQVLGVSLDNLLNDGPCSTCSDEPPTGFTCNACGLGLPELPDIRQMTNPSRGHFK